MFSKQKTINVKSVSISFGWSKLASLLYAQFPVEDMLQIK